MKGQNTTQFARSGDQFKNMKDRSMSVFYNDSEGNEMNLDIIIEDETLFEYLFKILRGLFSASQAERKNLSPDMLYLRDMWDRGDADGSGTLTESEICNLITSMNISMTAATIRKHFKQFDTDNSGALNFEEFTELIKELRER